MSHPIPTCSECGGPMSPGFLMDETHGSRHPVYWVEGEPVKSFWTGTKLSSRTVYTTESLRCDERGAVRLYARTRKR